MRVGTPFVPLNLPVAGRWPQRAFASHPFQLTCTALSFQMCYGRCRNAPLGTRVQPIQVLPCAQDGARAASYTSSNVSAFPPCSCPPCLSVQGRAGVLKGFLALNLLPFKGYLTSAEAAHTDMLSSQHRPNASSRKRLLRLMSALLESSPLIKRRPIQRLSRS